MTSKQDEGLDALFEEIEADLITELDAEAAAIRKVAFVVVGFGVCLAVLAAYVFWPF